jgi:hypothetical protein
MLNIHQFIFALQKAVPDWSLLENAGNETFYFESGK